MQKNKSAEEFLSIQDFWQICLGHISWFVISLIVTFSAAIYYLSSTPDMFTREAAVLVKQETTSPMVAQKSGGEDFNNMALVQQPTSVPNVQRQYTSLTLLTNVVRRLNLASDSVGIIKTAESIRRRLTVTQDNEQSTIINLKYVDFTPARAEQILNAIMHIYNENWLAERKQMASNTASFINDRLSVIERDLNQVDDSISTFKTRHQITNLESVSETYLQKQTESEGEIMRLSNQVSMAQYILDILKDKSARRQLLPTNSGINNSDVEAQITQYNSLLLKLKNNLVGTSSQNPLIIRQENELNEIRQNILISITNQIKTLKIQLHALQNYNDEAKEQISSSPEQAKRLLSVEREQKVKESLYLYLLQKKEENEMSQTYTPVHTQIIDMPHGSSFPTSPARRNVFLAALLIGLFLPIVILFAKENLNTTIRNRFEVESRSRLPIVGEIPYYVRHKFRRKWSLLPHSKNESISPQQLVVQHSRQDMVNEAFRLIRSNMEFMSDNSEHKNIYIITSMYAGSGKTFVSSNLSLTLAIKGRSVLLIDGDMRRASATKIFKNTGLGLADYLGEKVNTPDEIIYQYEPYPSLSIIPVGTIPPNPTELLSSPRLQELLEELRPRFDFIIIDCPMAENLADTTIIEHLADRTLYIVRAGLFQRKQIDELDASVQNGKFKNMSIIVNATKPNGRYGNKYGYYNAYYYYHK